MQSHTNHGAQPQKEGSTMETTQKIIARRIGLLFSSGNDSAALCATTALECADHDADGRHFPTTAAGQPQNWMESAEAWLRRGAQHAWGWERNWPAGW